MFYFTFQVYTLSSDNGPTSTQHWFSVHGDVLITTALRLQSDLHGSELTVPQPTASRMRIIRIKNPLCKMSSNGGGRHWAPFCCGRFRSLVLSFISLKHLAMLIVFISIITVVTKVTMRKSHGDAYSSVELKSLGLPDFKPLSRGARNVVNIYTIFNTSSFRHFANVKDVPSVHVPEVSCARLFEGDSVELAKAESYHGTYKTNQRNIDVVKLKNTAFVSCKKLKRDRQYLVKPINAEEEEFPLAFSILMYR